MNPIPLMSPRGVLYAFACGVCHRVCAGTSGLGGIPGQPNPRLVECHLDDAERCCRCSDCKGPLDIFQYRFGRCGACQKKADAATRTAVRKASREQRKSKR